MVSKTELDRIEARNLISWLEKLTWKDWPREDPRFAAARAGDEFASLTAAFDARTHEASKRFVMALTPDAKGEIPAGEDVAGAVKLNFAGRLVDAVKAEGVSGALDLLEARDTKPFFDAAGFSTLARDIRDGKFRPKKEENKAAAWLWLLPLLLLLGAGGAGVWWFNRAKAPAAVEEATLTPQSMPKPAAAQAAPVLKTEAVPAAEPEAVAAPPPPPPPPPPVKKKLFESLSWRETAKFSGQDAAGKPADFTAYVLVGSDTWSFASAEDIETQGTRTPVAQAFAKAPFSEGFCELAAVFAVGAASVEGSSELNAALSDGRSTQLNAAITSAAPACAEAAPQRMRLLLGQNKKAAACPEGVALCPELTAYQRPMALIVAEAGDPSTDVSAALTEGLAAHEAAGGEIFPGTKVSDYSGLAIAP